MENIFISIVLISSIFVKYPSVLASRMCREPNDLPSITSDLTSETAKMIPNQILDTVTGELRTIPRGFVNITRERIQENFEHAVHNRANNRRCSVRSTCPWHYVINIDENRKPKELTEAQCSYSCCNKKRRCSPLEPKCKPIIYYVPVLRRNGCDDQGIYTYTQILEPLAAGCTCTEQSLMTVSMPMY